MVICSSRQTEWLEDVKANRNTWKPKPHKYLGWDKIEYLFVFGDSYSSIGFDPRDGNLSPKPGNPLGISKYPGVTLSTYSNWVNYLTAQYNKTQVLTYDLAIPGATISPLYTHSSHSTLKSQINLLVTKLKPTPTLLTATNSVYILWIGTNDLLRHPNIHSDGLLDAYFQSIDSLYKFGARNFLIIDVPSIDRAPHITSPALLKKTIRNFNAALTSRAKELRRKKRDSIWIGTLSINRMWQRMLDLPDEYGFLNVKEVCAEYSKGTPSWDTFHANCRVPVDKYFWQDGIHPTSQVGKLMARQLAKALQ